ncbi:hypothetical protein JCM13991_13480 [Thermodesulfovibrio hydrogeniphilus]
MRGEEGKEGLPRLTFGEARNDGKNKRQARNDLPPRHCDSERGEKEAISRKIAMNLRVCNYEDR